MTSAEAVALLRNDPKDFLTKNFLTIAGDANRPASNTIFSMTMADGSTYGRGTVLKFRIKRRPMWRVSTSNSPNPPRPLSDNEFEAFYVPMMQITDLPSATHAVLPDTEGHLMVTSQLSGCLFGHATLGNSTVVSHLQQPPNNVPDRTRDTRTRLQSGLSGAGKIIERGSGYNHYASVVGIRRNGMWAFYCQRQDLEAAHQRRIIAAVTRL